MNKQQQQSLEKRKKSIRKLYDKHTLNSLFIFWIENHFDSDNFDASICSFFSNLLAYTDPYQRQTVIINTKQRYE